MAELCPAGAICDNHYHLSVNEDNKFRRRASYPHYLYLRWHEFFENWEFSARH